MDSFKELLNIPLKWRIADPGNQGDDGDNYIGTILFRFNISLRKRCSPSYCSCSRNSSLSIGECHIDCT